MEALTIDSEWLAHFLFQDHLSNKRAKLAISNNVVEQHFWPMDQKQPLTFCLRPSAKDQGITWVVAVLLVLLVHHLVHFLLKINLCEKNFSLPVNWTGVLLLTSQAHYQLSYGNIVTNCWKIICLTLEFQKPCRRPWTNIGWHLL